MRPTEEDGEVFSLGCLVNGWTETQAFAICWCNFLACFQEMDPHRVCVLWVMWVRFGFRFLPLI
ncbi:hypothetical protein SADUNF_Sadunf04G0020900 [Salix dunnii]|uniref:Uncharacterized protein n=1 Tax=Salix dunnii TaxID=1413687 RepID=A0A835K3E9_9ROSI|nr:hypothetical protein SADUNF_Sadunf04G0020900 [Salix dunnii]